MSKFFKDDKIARSQLGEYKVFVEFISAYLHQIKLHLKLCCYLLIDMKNTL